MAASLEKVSIIPAADTPSTAVTPMVMLAQAVERGADITVIEKMMGLSERWEANQARKAFDAAVSNAKAEIPPVVRNREGHNKARYADFAAIAAVVDPILSRHGLSYRFRSTQGDRINVACILSHKDGHFEETTLSGPADTSGNKNAVQAIGSTLTYLQRYSLVQALGLAASNDDDGKAAGMGPTITEDQVGELVALIEDVKADKAGFLKYMKIDALADLPASQFKRACDALNAKRSK